MPPPTWGARDGCVGGEHLLASWERMYRQLSREAGESMKHENVGLTVTTRRGGMAVIGTEPAEHGVDVMGKIAQSVISEIDIPTYKGIFGYTIKTPWRGLRSAVLGRCWRNAGSRNKEAVCSNPSGV